ncbi:PEGA domain-containing protein [Spirochaeta cellobiosiphila]|uniref:PEGA domain-containing protein n=1 Tax=Spirochaeta cellobiosiphila TaxID=504483 RepID=UPI00041D2D52|nr:PEGA domain-containing protein [Spirochaeta cellobiosiphila]
MSQLLFGQNNIGLDNWSWGIGQFDSNGNVSEIYPSYTIPLLIKSLVSGLRYHTLNKEERSQLIREYKNEQKTEYIHKLNKAIDERDQIIFKDNENSLSAQNDKIIEIKEQIQKIDEEEYIIEPTLPLEFAEGSEDGLIPVKDWKNNISTVIENKKLTAFIYGEISLVQDMIHYNVYIKNKQGIIFSQSGILKNKDGNFVDGEVEFAPLLAFVQGQEDKVVKIHTENRNMNIFVNDEYVGQGEGEFVFQTPPYTITAHASEGDVTMSINTMPEGTLELSLPSIEGKDLYIQTEPEGVDVYLNSRYVGKTPLSLKVFDKDQIFLDKAEYKSESFLANQSKGDVIKMLPNEERKELSYYRGKFYRSLTVFSFSLFPTFIFPQLQQNYYQLSYNYYNSGRYDDYAEAIKMTNAMTYGRWISFGISVSSFSWMVYDFIKYIKQAEILGE